MADHCRKFSRSRQAVVWATVTTVIGEWVTIACRALTGFAAADIPETTHWLLRMHHMFWCIPLLLILPLVWKSARISGTLVGVSAGLIISDLLHHFAVLPIWVGNTGWHWP